MLNAFKQASKSILAVMGEDAFLRGETTPCKVNIEHGVQTIGAEDQVIYTHDVATISLDNRPATGDMLVHPDGTYKLDAVYQRNGFTARFILLKVA